jgi:hypothetical protein
MTSTIVRAPGLVAVDVPACQAGVVDLCHTFAHLLRRLRREPEIAFDMGPARGPFGLGAKGRFHNHRRAHALRVAAGKRDANAAADGAAADVRRTDVQRLHEARQRVGIVLDAVVALNRVRVAVPRHVPGDHPHARQQVRQHFGVLPARRTIGVDQDQRLAAARVLVMLTAVTMDGDETIMCSEQRGVGHANLQARLSNLGSFRQAAIAARPRWREPWYPIGAT